MPDFKRGRKLPKNRNLINWFEIPVSDFERAQQFYETVLNLPLTVEKSETHQIGFFPMYKGKITGSIVRAPGYTPSNQGPKIYLNADPDLDIMLSKVESVGGKILSPKTLISKKIGYFGWFEDSEGNHIALHSKH